MEGLPFWLVWSSNTLQYACHAIGRCNDVVKVLHVGGGGGVGKEALRSSPLLLVGFCLL